MTRKAPTPLSQTSSMRPNDACPMKHFTGAFGIYVALPVFCYLQQNRKPERFHQHQTEKLKPTVQQLIPINTSSRHQDLVVSHYFVIQRLLQTQSAKWYFSSFKTKSQTAIKQCSFNYLDKVPSIWCARKSPEKFYNPEHTNLVRRIQNSQWLLGIKC